MSSSRPSTAQTSAAPLRANPTKPSSSRQNQETFGTRLSRASPRATPPPSSLQPWRYELKHKSSITLPRSQRARQQAATRRAQATTLRAKLASLASEAREAVRNVAGSCFRSRSGGESPSVRGREIKIVHNTGHRMESRDYDVYEHGPSRRAWLGVKAREAGMGGEEFCAMEKIRY